MPTDRLGEGQTGPFKGWNAEWFEEVPALWAKVAKIPRSLRCKICGKVIRWNTAGANAHVVAHVRKIQQRMGGR